MCTKLYILELPHIQYSSVTLEYIKMESIAYSYLRYANGIVTRCCLHEGHPQQVVHRAYEGKDLLNNNNNNINYLKNAFHVT